MENHLSKTVCPVCPRHCALSEGQAGFCRAREARGGKVECVNYGHLTSLSLDPIEKKPLARFHPGSMILSAGSYGCNMRCWFCQNHAISQQAACPPGRRVPPEALVSEALSTVPRGNIGLAFTYNEPGVGYEYVRDTSLLARQQGLKNVMVTNGYLCPEPLEELIANIDAFNIDLKCFTPEGYERLGGGFSEVLAAIRRVARTAHLEVTTLVVPGLSDSEADMAAEARWLAALNPDIPLHISRYFPRWQAKEPATPPKTVQRLAEIARRHLRYVFVGNL